MQSEIGFLKRLKLFVQSKHFWKHFSFITLVYLFIVFITIFYLDFKTNHGEKIKVPSLVGKNVKKINSIMESVGLNYEILDSVYYPKLKEGTIISQDPRPTDSTHVYVKSTRVIKVRVSKKYELVEVPSLIHRSERFAISVLKNRGLKYQISYKPSSEANGAVLEQTYKGSKIKENKKILKGSLIHLVVGKNEAGMPIQIPNLIGLTINEVQIRLNGMGRLTYFPSFINCISTADSTVAKVISQSPEYIEGQTIPSNSTITIQLDKNYTGTPQLSPQ
ncbi:MAG: PASTA domain-containing protein [Flavobacteriia bacterium]|nr:PASTA domain-containing protein [Flavobacteriia bacterium]